MSAKTNDLEDDFEDDLIDVNAKDDGDDIEIEIEDDTPEEDRGKPIAGVESQDEEDDSEMEQYGDKVAKRIRTVTAQKHDERRAKELAFRERDAAINDARRVRDENAKLQTQLLTSASSTITATKAQAASEVTTIKDQLRNAVELGDGEKVADLTQKLGEANFKLMSAGQAEEHLKTIKVTAPAQQQQTQPVSVSDRQRQWMKANPWFDFEKNPRMSAYAMAVHSELTTQGVAPETDSYYNTIDKEMRTRFPEEFKSSKQSQSRTSSPPVAGVNRQGGGGARRKPVVKLDTSELSIAKQLGITPKEYARQKLKMESA